jgi:hypothetical protein
MYTFLGSQRLWSPKTKINFIQFVLISELFMIFAMPKQYFSFFIYMFILLFVWISSWYYSGNEKHITTMTYILISVSTIL